MNNQTLNDIKDFHTVSWKGIKKILIERKTFRKKPFIYSIVITFLICLLIAVFKSEQSYDLLKEITEMVVSIFPNLLGFSLGGYAIVVGFSNNELIKKATKIRKYSVFQQLSAIFAMTVLFQVITVFIALIITCFIKFESTEILPNLIGSFGNYVNVISLFLLLLGAVYSLVMTPYIVYNLFTLSQLVNSHFTIEKAKEDHARNAANAQQQASQNPNP
ncbi:MAG: hypothetical protein V4561_12745 [Bacteroidota bacterium]